MLETILAHLIIALFVGSLLLLPLHLIYIEIKDLINKKVEEKKDLIDKKVEEKVKEILSSKGLD